MDAELLAVVEVDRAERGSRPFRAKSGGFVWISFL